MAAIYHNITLEYATNTIEFWRYADNGEEEPFPSVVEFNIRREDDENNSYSTIGTVVGNHVVFNVTPPISLFKSSDSVYDYRKPEYNHIFSVKSANDVFIVGKVNLIKVA